jgi:hypothetical protein
MVLPAETCCSRDSNDEGRTPKRTNLLEHHRTLRPIDTQQGSGMRTKQRKRCIHCLIVCVRIVHGIRNRRSRSLAIQHAIGMNHGRCVAAITVRFCLATSMILLVTFACNQRESGRRR